MALKDLITPQMISLVEPWTDATTEAYGIIDGSDLARPLLVPIAAVRQALIDLQPDAAREAAQADLVTRAGQADARHDDFIRAVLSLLLGLLHLAEAEGRLDDAAAYQALADALFPDGLLMTRASYVAQAGAVEQLNARLSDAQRAALGAIPLPDGRTLAHVIDDLIATGRALGQIEDERARLSLEARTAATRPAAILEKRNLWCRLVHALVNALQLDGVPAASIQIVMGRIEASARAAHLRRMDNVTAANTGDDATDSDAAPAASETPDDATPAS